MYTPLDIENKKFAKQMVNGYNCLLYTSDAADE